MIEIIQPQSQQHWLEMRTMDVTSTETAALFGLSPYMTEFELWHRKKDAVIVKLEENERMFWGTTLQDAIAGGIAKKQGWQIRRMDEYIRDTELRLGASFDFSIEQFVPHMPLEEHQKGLLEIKNVDALIFRDGWSFDEDGDLEAPPHIEIQVQQQLFITKRPVVHIGALVGGNKVQMIERHPDQVVMDAIATKVGAFWQSIKDDRPPEPDFIKDAEFITSLYGYADPGKVLDARDDSEFQMWASEHKRLGEEIKHMTEVRDGFKARMLTRMEDAEKVLGDGFSISAGIIGEAEIAYTRKPYRMFKPSWKKVKS